MYIDTLLGAVEWAGHLTQTEYGAMLERGGGGPEVM